MLRDSKAFKCQLQSCLHCGQRGFFVCPSLNTWRRLRHIRHTVCLFVRIIPHHEAQSNEERHTFPVRAHTAGIKPWVGTQRKKYTVINNHSTAIKSITINMVSKGGFTDPVFKMLPWWFVPSRPPDPERGETWEDTAIFLLEHDPNPHPDPDPEAFLNSCSLGHPCCLEDTSYGVSERGSRQDMKHPKSKDNPQVDILVRERCSLRVTVKLCGAIVTKGTLRCVFG